MLLRSTQRRGAEVTGAALADALARRDHRVDTVALRAHADGQPGLDVPIAPQGIRQLAWVRRRAKHADVVIAYGSRTLLVAAAATAAGPPFVYQSIGDLLTWSGQSRLRRWRVGVELRRAAAVVTLWDAVADDVVRRLGVERARVHTIPNGRDAEHFRPPIDAERAAARAELGVPDGAPCLVTVGSLTEEKRIGTAIEAASLVPGAALVVVGDGPERVALEHAAVSHDRVTFLGAVDDVRPALRAADVILSTSRTEGLPGALIEAGMCAVPAVATDVGGTREIVDSSTGALVPPTADSAQIAAEVEAVLADRDALGRAARARGEQRFDFASVVDQWEAVLDKSLRS